MGSTPRAGRIEHSVANGLPLLRRFFGAALSRRQAAQCDPASRYTLRRNAASVNEDLICMLVELACYCLQEFGCERTTTLQR